MKLDAVHLGQVGFSKVTLDGRFLNVMRGCHLQRNSAESRDMSDSLRFEKGALT